MTIGTDIEQVSRIRRALARTPRFAERLFTAAERAYCDVKPQPAQHYAARFCAKEALAKAIGQPLSWLEVEVVTDADGAPSFRLHGRSAETLGGRQAHLSLSHAGAYAVAMVVVED